VYKVTASKLLVTVDVLECEACKISVSLPVIPKWLNFANIHKHFSIISREYPEISQVLAIRRNLLYDFTADIYQHQFCWGIANIHKITIAEIKVTTEYLKRNYFP
jgi:hypothetical protein